jgi:quercetin dioxygenase-like cupin family protein
MIFTYNNINAKENNSVISSLPNNLEEGVKVDSRIFVFFDKTISSTANSDTIQLKENDSNKLIAGSIETRGNALIFSPTNTLRYGTKYQLTSKDNDVSLTFTTKAIVLETPALTHTPADSTAEFNIAPSGEVYTPITDPARIAEHAKFHPYKPLITATLPSLFTPPAMDKLSDFANLKQNLTIINPGQVSDPIHDEFLWVMEGKRHGFQELTIVQTNTPSGNGGPLHTHFGEESHVLMEGKIRYHLKVGDLEQEFTMEAPYVINIPSMAPHAFMNVGDKPAIIVGIFPASTK